MRWALILFLLLATGCQTADPKPPPFGPAFGGIPRSKAPQRPQAEPKVVAVPLQLVWYYDPQRLPEVYFRIWNAHQLGEAWSIFALVTNSVSFPFTSQEEGYFWMEAIDPLTGLSSGPNR